MPDLLRAAAIQLTTTADRARNLETADRLVRNAAADGAQLVVMPEKWSVLGTPETMCEGAEPLDGPALSWVRSTAAELSIDLVAGSIAERADSGSNDRRNANTSVHVGPDGRDLARSRTGVSSSRPTSSASTHQGYAPMIVDPWGVVLAQARDAQTHIVTDLDLEHLARIRATLPSLSGRKPEVYRA